MGRRKKNKAEDTGIDLTEQEREIMKEYEEVRSQMAIIEKSKVEAVYVFEPDELISGSEVGFGIYTIALRTAGNYKRGELLMMSGNQFVKATKDALASAESLVILSDDMEVTGEDNYAEVLAYSSGRFMAKKVILPYETEDDDHDALIEELRPVLLKFKIYLD